MKKGILPFLFLLFIFNFSFAQNSPTQSMLLPFSSVSTSDDALSIVQNPAGLGFRKGFLGGYFHSYSDSGFSGNDGLFLKTSGLGFSVEWLGYGSLSKYRKHTLASGYKIVRGFYWGTGYSWFRSSNKEIDKLSSWNMGILARPTDFLSIGFLASDLNKPKYLGEKTPISFTSGIALRPWGDRLTFSVDAFLKEKERIKKANTRYRVEFEPVDGLVLNGDLDNKGNFALGLKLNFPNPSIGSYNSVSKKGKYQEGLVYATVSSGRYRTLCQSKNNFLELKLSGNIEEEKAAGLFAPKKRTMLDLLEELRRAKKDKTVQGLLLRIDGLSLGWGKAQEIRDAILDFKESGKKVVAYMEMGGNKEYFIATSADKIVMNPSGALTFTGLQAQVTFYKKTLEKLGIVAEFEHSGNYKTASDLLTRDEMSDAHREVVNSILDDLNEQLKEKIAYSLNLTPQQVQEKIDNAPYTAKEAKEEKLVNELAYYDQIDSLIQEMMSKKEEKLNEKDYQYRTYYQNNWEAPSKIAVIFATGIILEGKSGSNFILGKIMGSETIAGAIRKAREDKSIKAIVFRIDSHGGSSLASDIIWREINLTKGEKPFIVSMSDVAGSGGYHIACLGDTILASPGTITGSIGVISGKFNLKGLYEKIGFTKETVKRGKYADFFNMSKGWTEEEREIIRKLNKEGYDDFVNKVAEGRGLSYSQVDSIGQGRVWTGNQAKKIGLVDILGGLEEAISIAKKRAGVTEEEVEIIISPKPKWSLNFPLGSILGLSEEEKKVIEKFKEISLFEEERILYLIPFDIEIK
jgi:protease-4